MNIIEDANLLVSNNDVKEDSESFINDIIEGVLGNPWALAKVMIAIAKSPFYIREQLFWSKLETFLNGIYLEESDRAILRAKLAENGNSNENALRLVASIDRAETMQKIQYLVNVTRCLLTNFIDRPTYFRICHAVTFSLEEDLSFLKDHIDEEDLVYNSYVQGLLTTGLMYQSVIDGNDESKYSFTPLAGLVDQYAVSYENLERYPNPKQITDVQTILRQQISLEALTDDDMDDILRKI